MLNRIVVVQECPRFALGKLCNGNILVAMQPH